MESDSSVNETRIDLSTLQLRLIEPSSEPGAIGKVGSFHLQKELGRGGMGVVFKAWDESLRRIVAVKFIREDSLQSHRSHELFFREARAAAAVTHPNIVVVHRIDEIKGTPFIVMEYVDGVSLYSLLATGKRLQPIELFQILLQITEGLQAAHDKGIIHRDIKPSNVLVESGSGRSKISDFGLARTDSEISPDSVKGAVMGTPDYMSPEQLRGETIDCRSDLFSLGCLIYAMVTGHSPFHAKTFADTATRVLTSNPSPLSTHNPTVPLVLSNICSKLLEKEPGNRYQAAKDVGREIRQVLLEMQRGMEIPMVETIAIKPPSQQRQKRLRMAGIICAIALLPLTGLWYRYGNMPLSTTSEGKENPIVPKKPAIEEKIRLLTVSKTDSAADYRNLTGAMGDARPDDTIRVLDDRTYEVNLNFQGLQNLRLEAPQRAKLVPLNVEQPVLKFTDSHNILLRGFKIAGDEPTVAHMKQSSGIIFEDLDIAARPRENAVIEISSCNESPESSPLIIRRCRIESQGNGQCMWITANHQPTWNLEVTENTFLAQFPTTVIVLSAQSGRFTIDRNIFDGGHVGINLNLSAASQDQKEVELSLNHNTFHRLNSWIGLLDSDPQKTPFQLQNCLILSCRSVEANAAQQLAIADSCNCGGNVWERTDSLLDFETDHLKLWTKFVSHVGVQSRERGADGFMKLPPDSPFRTGAGASVEPPGALP